MYFVGRALIIQNEKGAHGPPFLPADSGTALHNCSLVAFALAGDYSDRHIARFCFTRTASCISIFCLIGASRFDAQSLLGALVFRRVTHEVPPCDKDHALPNAKPFLEKVQPPPREGAEVMAGFYTGITAILPLAGDW